MEGVSSPFQRELKAVWDGTRIPCALWRYDTRILEDKVMITRQIPHKHLFRSAMCSVLDTGGGNPVFMWQQTRHSWDKCPSFTSTGASRRCPRIQLVLPLLKPSNTLIWKWQWLGKAWMMQWWIWWPNDSWTRDRPKCRSDSFIHLSTDRANTNWKSAQWKSNGVATPLETLKHLHFMNIYR